MVFIAIGGDGWLLRGIARTFSLVPLSAAVNMRALAAGAVSELSGVLVAAVEVAAPVLLAVVVTDLGFGMVSRVMPQLNVFAVGLPAKIAVALVTLGAALPFLAGFASQQLITNLGNALTTIGAHP
jgi:flagellar biosynthetic protein FliR